jgi:hypothetical protein
MGQAVMTVPRRKYPHRRGVLLRDFVRVARRKHRFVTAQLPWHVFVYYKGHDIELDELLRRIVGGAAIGSGTEIQTMKRDLQFGFKTERQARDAAARVPWWLKVRVKVKRALKVRVNVTRASVSA